MVTAVVFNAVIDTIVAIFSGGILYVLTLIIRWGRSVEKRLDKIEDIIQETAKVVKNNGSNG